MDWHLIRAAAVDLSRVLFVWLAEQRGGCKQASSDFLRSAERSCKKEKENCLLQLGVAQAEKEPGCQSILVGIVGALLGFVFGVFLCIVLFWRVILPLLTVPAWKGKAVHNDKVTVEVEALPIASEDERLSAEVAAARRRARSLRG